jgi:hypothetical protein
VPEASLMGRKGAAFGFSAFAVSVGVSYFARLAGRDAELRAAAEACADFAGFVAGAPTDAEPLPAPLGAAAGRYGCGGAPRRWLVAVHLACILLAAKNIDRRAPARACQAAGGHAASPGGALSTVTGGRGHVKHSLLEQSMLGLFMFACSHDAALNMLHPVQHTDGACVCCARPTAPVARRLPCGFAALNARLPCAGAVPCRDLGRLLLAHSRGTPATAYEARDLELEVLVALRWRLGPFL